VGVDVGVHVCARSLEIESVSLYACACVRVCVFAFACEFIEGWSRKIGKAAEQGVRATHQEKSRAAFLTSLLRRLD
jgi:hypothetical protein